LLSPNHPSWAYSSLQPLTNLSTPKATNPTATSTVTTSKGFEELRMMIPSLVKIAWKRNRKLAEKAKKKMNLFPIACF